MWRTSLQIIHCIHGWNQNFDAFKLHCVQLFSFSVLFCTLRHQKYPVKITKRSTMGLKQNLSQGQTGFIADISHVPALISPPIHSPAAHQTIGLFFRLTFASFLHCTTVSNTPTLFFPWNSLLPISVSWALVCCLLDLLPTLFLICFLPIPAFSDLGVHFTSSSSLPELLFN